jgi:hypothetical protein
MVKFDRITKLLLSLLVVGVWCLLVFSFFRVPPVEAGALNAVSTDQTQKVIRARGLIIVDEQGRERIIMGSPVPDPPHMGKRISPGHGMIILDEQGYERFGLGLMDNGQMGMGFDAPPDPANPRKNTERLHFIADAKGGAMIRFLNRQTGVPGWIRLGDDDKLYLEFIDVQKDKNKVIKRQLSIDGEKMVEQPFKP